jgi:glycosyltransferase involved in cell wall biosynthesis
MRIALISDWFSEKMGYSENCLPKALAALGFDVHLIASTGQVYCDAPFYRETYEPFLGPPVVSCEVKQIDGYTLHRLPLATVSRQRRIRGLVPLLRRLKPDITQTFDAMSLSTFEAAVMQPVLRYRLFLEAHVHASVFYASPIERTVESRLKWFTARRVFSPIVSGRAERCYAISSDAAAVATREFGIDEHKVAICSLGVDTTSFRPADDGQALMARAALRQRYGFADDEVICIYTGRFASDKNPACLAAAVNRLIEMGERVRSFFVGGGEQEGLIRSYRGSVVQPFLPASELAALYRASDIGVWPAQESISQLDAAACGLPIVVSHRVHVTERVEGNGLTYVEGDAGSLASAIRSLLDPQLRHRFGATGRQKVERSFSWARIASDRARDYVDALAN